MPEKMVKMAHSPPECPLFGDKMTKIFCRIKKILTFAVPIRCCSSDGRAMDWKSMCRQFDSSQHHKKGDLKTSLLFCGAKAPSFTGGTAPRPLGPSARHSDFPETSRFPTNWRKTIGPKQSSRVSHRAPPPDYGPWRQPFSKNRPIMAFWKGYLCACLTKKFVSLQKQSDFRPILQRELSI